MFNCLHKIVLYRGTYSRVLNRNLISITEFTPWISNLLAVHCEETCNLSMHQFLQFLKWEWYLIILSLLSFSFIKSLIQAVLVPGYKMVRIKVNNIYVSDLISNQDSWNTLKSFLFELPTGLLKFIQMGSPFAATSWKHHLMDEFFTSF